MLLFTCLTKPTKKTVQNLYSSMQSQNFRTIGVGKFYKKKPLQYFHFSDFLKRIKENFKIVIVAFRSGDILEQVYGLKFKDEFIWIGKTNMTVFDDQNQNIPFLEMSMFEYSNYEKFGECAYYFDKT